MKKSVLKNFAIFTEKHHRWSYFSSSRSGTGTLFKNDSNADIFLWILRNFLEHLLCQNKIKTLSGRTKAFNSSFYPYSIRQWCVLSEEIRNIVSVNKFKESIISFIRPKENSVFAIRDTKGLKLLTRLRLNFSHLNKHIFRHGFKDIVDPMCKCDVETETTLYFLLRCKLYSNMENRTPGRYIYILLTHLLRIILKINF